MRASGKMPSSVPPVPNSSVAPPRAGDEGGGMAGGRHRQGDAARVEVQAGEDRGREASFEVLIEHRGVDAREHRRGRVAVAGVGGGRVAQEGRHHSRLGALAADVADDQPAAVAVGEHVVEVAADFAAGAHRAEVARQVETGDVGQGRGHQAPPQRLGDAAPVRRRAGRCRRPARRARSGPRAPAAAPVVGGRGGRRRSRRSSGRGRPSARRSPSGRRRCPVPAGCPRSGWPRRGPARG